jgi:hypothetical protein
MAKRKKIGAFKSMDFIIVGGIAAIAYFLFSSFTTKKNTNNNNNTNGQITPVIPPVTPPSGAVTTQGTTPSASKVNFTDAQMKTVLYKGMSENLMVRALQIFLTKRGCNPNGIDGAFGTGTENALIKCRQKGEISDQEDIGDDAQVMLKGIYLLGWWITGIDVSKNAIYMKAFGNQNEVEIKL